MDEILEFVPGGPWIVGAVALLAVPGVRRSLRPLAKGAIKAGLTVAEGVKSMTAEAREQATDLYEEVKTERQEQQNEPAEETTRVAPVTPSRARRTETTGATT